MATVRFTDRYPTGEEVTFTADSEVETVVSLFETWTIAYDATNMTQEQIEEALTLPREEIEDFAVVHDLEEIKLVPAENTGSDNNYHIVSHQDSRKAIVADVNGVFLYDGGVREYMDDFGDYWNGAYYYDDSGNYRLAVEDEDMGVSID